MNQYEDAYQSAVSSSNNPNTIDGYKAAYESARARGDAAGMQAANDGANAIRAAQGIAPEYANEDIASVRQGGLKSGVTPAYSGASNYPDTNVGGATPTNLPNTNPGAATVTKYPNVVKSSVGDYQNAALTAAKNNANTAQTGSTIDRTATYIQDAMNAYNSVNAPAKTLDDYSREYNDARARGDWQAMQAANDGANALRASMGQAAQYATDDINMIRANAERGYTNTPTVYGYDANGNPILKTTYRTDQLTADAYIINGQAYRDPAGTQPLPMNAIYYDDAGAKQITANGVADYSSVDQALNQFYNGEISEENLYQIASNVYSDFTAPQRGNNKDQSANKGVIFTPTAFTPDKLDISGMTATDATEYIKEVYEKSAAAAIQQLKTAYDKNLATVEEEAAKLPDLYQTYKNALAAEYEVNRMRMNEVNSANGISSGSAAQMGLSTNNTYMAKLYDFELKEAEQMAALERDRANLRIDYDNAVAQAVINNDMQQADALLKEFIRLDDSRIQAAYQQAEYDYKMLTLQYQQDQFDRQMAMQEYQFNQQMEYKKAADEAQMAYQYATLGMKYGGGSGYSGGGGTSNGGYTGGSQSGSDAGLADYMQQLAMIDPVQAQAIITEMATVNGKVDSNTLAAYQNLYDAYYNSYLDSMSPYQRYLYENPDAKGIMADMARMGLTSTGKQKAPNYNAEIAEEYVYDLAEMAYNVYEDTLRKTGNVNDAENAMASWLAYSKGENISYLTGGTNYTVTPDMVKAAAGVIAKANGATTDKRHA